MSKFDSDGFQIVSTKRNSRNKSTKIPSRDVKLPREDLNVDLPKAYSRIQAARDDLQGSEYLKEVLESVSTLLQSRTVGEIVCLGLGHIGECQISSYQLALLLSLKDKLNPTKVLAHDPIFYKNECEILKTLQVEVISENKEGHYIISDKNITVLYLPHCPKQLTNNFLWSNWDPNLSNCILICNSFASIIESQPDRIVSQIVPQIFKIYPYTTEVPLTNKFKYTDIFNDTSIHKFCGLEKLDSDFWIKGDKPSYENNEEFITSLMIEKLSI